MECFILNKLGPTNFYSCIKVNLKYAIECSCTPAPCHTYILKSCPPKMMALGDETFGGYLDMWVEPWWILVPYNRGHREIPNSFYHVSTKREVFCCEEGRGTSPECNHPCDLMLDFVASRAGKNKCCLSYMVRGYSLCGPNWQASYVPFFFFWLFSPSINILRFIHVVACIVRFVHYWMYFISWLLQYFLLHWSVSEHWDYFWYLAIIVKLLYAHLCSSLCIDIYFPFP